MNANERRQEILEVLSARRQDTMENLAYEFGVSKRTIQRDIETISLKKPVYTMPGKGGGVRFMAKHSVGRKYLTIEQANLIKKLIAAVDDSEADILNSIIDVFAIPSQRV